MRFLIVRDSKENRRKCTLTPLEGRPEIRFLRLPRPQPGAPAPPIEVGPGILLQLEAPPLSRDDRSLLHGGEVVVIDSTWARVPTVLGRLTMRPGAVIERRSLPAGLETAYPRSSKLYRDPPAGLASVEALFAAAAILGEPDETLLASYRWGEAFLERNRGFFRGSGRDAPPPRGVSGAPPAPL